MFASIRDSIPFLIMKSRTDGDVDRAITRMTWPSFVNMMSKHEVRTDKHGLSIIPAKFKPKENWVLSEPREDYTPTYRNHDNVEAITIAIIDLDKEGALETAERVLGGFEHFVYSTHSYNLDTPYKFRAVIKLDKPIPVEDWPLAFACLTSQIDADKQCGNADRLYYLPAISPNAGTLPVFKHNRGRDMTYDDILRLGGDNPQELLRNKNIEKVKRRHFAGMDTVELSLAQRVHWTWDAMLLRNKDIIEGLRSDDSRHHFSLRITKDEVRRYKEQVNIEHLVSFMYKAALEFSSKAMNAGNTPREIPEHIESAFRKYAGKDAIDKFQQENGMTLKNAVNLAISKADWSQVTGKWVIDEKIEVLVASGGAPTPAEMRILQSQNMRSLIAHGDQEKYAFDCFDSYLNSGKPFKADIFSEFLVESYGAYLKKFQPEISAKDALKDAVSKFIPMDFVGHVNGKPGSEYARFIRPSIRKNVEKNYSSDLSMSR